VGAVIWVVLLAVVSFFYEDLYRSLWLLAGLLVLLLLFLGVSLWIAALGALAWRPRKSALIAVLLLIPTGAYVSLCYGSYCSHALQFRLRRNEYEAVVARFQGQSAPLKADVAATDCSVLSRKPLRLLFEQPAVGCDRQAIVFDPSGLVRRFEQSRSSRSTAERHELAEMKRIFGTHLFSVDSLGGSWYWCEFSLDL
jgi:hypothetical protein